MSAAATKVMTFEEFAPIYEGTRYELIAGIPTELPMPAGGNHGYSAMNLGAEMRAFVKPRKLGRISGLDNFVMTKRNPDTVRGADVSYYSYATVPAGQDLPGRQDAYILPDIIGEVNSPSDRPDDIDDKVEEYLEAGVKVVLVLDPEALSVTVRRPGELPLVLDNGDELTIPDLLPGFSVSVRSLFEE